MSQAPLSYALSLNKTILNDKNKTGNDFEKRKNNPIDTKRDTKRLHRDVEQKTRQRVEKKITSKNPKQLKTLKNNKQKINNHSVAALSSIGDVPGPFVCLFPGAQRSNTHMSIEPDFKPRTCIK